MQRLKRKRRKKTYQPPQSQHSAAGHGKITDTKVSQLGLHLEYLFEYGVNFKTRSITISGEIDEPWFDIVDAALTEMESTSKKSITVKIKSFGGCSYEAIAIVGRLRRSKCYIVTEGYGVIMSAATLLLACGDKRKVSRFTHTMHHESSYDVEGRHSNVKATIKQMDREEKFWAKWMAEFSYKDQKFWYKTGKHIDAYFTAEKLLELGVVDEIMD